MVLRLIHVEFTWSGWYMYITIGSLQERLVKCPFVQNRDWDNPVQLEESSTKDQVTQSSTSRWLGEFCKHVLIMKKMCLSLGHLYYVDKNKLALKNSAVEKQYSLLRSMQ